jgi:hypothetical protein
MLVDQPCSTGSVNAHAQCGDQLDQNAESLLVALVLPHEPDNSSTQPAQLPVILRMYRRGMRSSFELHGAGLQQNSIRNPEPQRATSNH